MAGKDDQIGRDLRMVFDSLGGDLEVGDGGDLETVGGAQNLAQAILIRLKTERGELAELGHPNYGSRLHEFYGQPNTERVKGEIRRSVRDCILQDNRVERVEEVLVRDTEDPCQLEIEIAVVPRGGGRPIRIALPFSLEGL